MAENQENMEKTYVQGVCDCGNEIMEVDYDYETKTFWFYQFKYSPIRYSLWRRIKFLFSGYIGYNEISLDHTNAKYIADYINQYIKTNG